MTLIAIIMRKEIRTCSCSRRTRASVSSSVTNSCSRIPSVAQTSLRSPSSSYFNTIIVIEMAGRASSVVRTHAHVWVLYRPPHSFPEHVISVLTLWTLSLTSAKQNVTNPCVKVAQHLVNLSIILNTAITSH
jgi:hypothetical protein